MQKTNAMMRAKGLPLAEREQTLLLQTLLLERSAGEQAWERWRAEFELDTISFPGFRLLPAVYKRLVEWERGDEPLLEKLRGIYKKNLAQVNLLFYSSSLVLKRFEAANLGYSLIKGAGLLLLTRLDMGTRFLTDVDVLIGRHDVSPALELLKAAGWRASSRNHWTLDEAISSEHSFEFVNERGLYLDLHWRPATARADRDFVEPSISRSLRCSRKHYYLAALDPSDQFFHTIFHYLSDPEPQRYWIYDIAVLGQYTNWRFDEQRVVEHVQRYQELEGFRAALGELCDEFCLPVDALRKRLEAKAIYPAEQFLRQLAIRRHEPVFYAGLCINLYAHLRRSRQRWLVLQLLTFPAYLRNIWGVSYLRLPLQFLKRVLAGARRGV